jgi:hypothetical protein
MAGSCEHGYENLGSIKAGNLFVIYICKELDCAMELLFRQSLKFMLSSCYLNRVDSE